MTTDSSFTPLFDPTDLSSSSGSADFEKQRRFYAALLGLGPLANLGPLLPKMSPEIRERLYTGFTTVVLPSLFTKIVGRAAILAHVVTPMGVGAGSFLLSNLLFVAPAIAVLAASIRFVWVFGEEIKKGHSFGVAFKNATKEAVKTAVKFFIVYMVWALAMLLAFKLGLLSGGLLLPVGLLLVGALTTLGFMAASFLVDKLPQYLANFKNSKHSLIGYVWQLKSGILPAMSEGVVWAAMDVVVNVSSRVASHVASAVLGMAMDMVAVSLAVSGAFFLGTIATCVVQSVYSVVADRTTKIKKHDDRFELERAINSVIEIPTPSDFEKLAKLLKPYPKNTRKIIISYIKHKIMYEACNSAFMSGNSNAMYIDFLKMMPSLEIGLFGDPLLNDLQKLENISKKDNPLNFSLGLKNKYIKLANKDFAQIQRATGLFKDEVRTDLLSGSSSSLQSVSVLPRPA